jgi:type I restriction enzyme R subunit
MVAGQEPVPRVGWRQKVQARAGVRLAIEDELDEGLPRACTKETYQTKCNVLFEHVYESYMGDGQSSYTEAA